MKKILSFLGGALSLLAIFLMLFFVVPAPSALASISFGDLIKASTPAVYYYGFDGKRYVFPNEKTYKTWYSDFSAVETITDDELAAIPIAGNVTYRPGMKMIKIQTDPKVYAVAKGGVLRWIKTEAMAIAIYGANWNKEIDDVPDAFFTNYTVGAEINSGADYGITTEANSSPTISDDRGLKQGSCSSSSATCGPLLIMSYGASDVTSTSAKIGWQTNWLAKGELQYGVDSLVNKMFFNNLLLVQEANLTNLTPNTIYKYKIIVEDAGGIKKETTEETFTTSASWITYKITDSLYRQKNPNIAASAESFGVVWTDNSGNQDDIKFGALDKNGNLSKGPFILSSNSYESITPSIAWSGLDYGVVWEDFNVTQREIYFGRIDTNGGRPMFEKAITNKSGFARNPKIVWNGSNYGVFWWDTRNAGDVGYTKGALYYQKINQTGQLFGNNLQLITRLSSEFKPDAVWGNNEFVTVWADNREGQKDIYFIRIDETGNAQGGGEVQITNTTVDSDNPAIVWDGTNYGIVWQKKNPNVGTEGTHYELYYQKVNTIGQKVGEIVRLTEKSAGDSEAPKIVKNGNKFGIVWTDYRGSVDRTNSEIYFMEIDSNGKILTAEQNISNSSGLSVEPSIVVLNGQYNIVYADYRDGNYEIYSAHGQ